MTHAELVVIAVRWLKNRCGIAYGEFVTASWEQPDAIGWRYSYSTLVECKASRADFMADKKKPYRVHPWLGLGHQRYFLVPDGLVTPDEAPTKWGLIYVAGRKVKIVKEAEGFAARSRAGEVAFLCSMLRRMERKP